MTVWGIFPDIIGQSGSLKIQARLINLLVPQSVPRPLERLGHHVANARNHVDAAVLDLGAAAAVEVSRPVLGEAHRVPRGR